VLVGEAASDGRRQVEPMPIRLQAVLILLRLCAVWLALGALLTVTPASAQGSLWLELTASQPDLVADGKTSLRIQATVRDRSGNLVDGQEVVFSTTRGQLSLDETLGQQMVQARTENGIATVFLVSTETGRATVRASAGMEKDQIDINLVSEEAAKETGADVVVLEGDWLGYSLDRNVIEVVGNATLVYRGLKISARDWIKVDVADDVAQALSATVTAGDASIETNRVLYDFRVRQGAFERVTESAGVEQRIFDGRTLELADESELARLSANAFRPIDTDETLTWVVADRALLFRGKKLALRHAKFYVGGKHVFTLPYHVVWLGAVRRDTQMLNISSASGLALDLPLYVSVTPRQMSSVRIRHGRYGDWFSSRPGWSLALRQDYERGDDVVGSIELNGLPRSDWGMSWGHRQQYGQKLSGYYSIRYPSHAAILGDVSLYSYDRARTMSFRSSFDKLPGRPLMTRSSFDWLLRGRPLGGTGLQYRVGNRVQLSTGGILGRTLSDQVSLGLYVPGWRLGARTSVRPRLDCYLGWDSRATRTRLLRGEIAMDHRLGGNTSLTLRYTYDEQSSNVYSVPVRQQIGVNISAGDYQNWYGYLSGTYDLSGNGLYAYSTFTHRLGRKYTLELLANYYRFQTGSSRDIQVGLSRAIGNREFSLRWSEARHRFWLELGESSF